VAMADDVAVPVIKTCKSTVMWPKPVMSWFWKPWGLSKQFYSLEGYVDSAIVEVRNLEISYLLDNLVKRLDKY